MWLMVWNEVGIVMLCKLCRCCLRFGETHECFCFFRNTIVSKWVFMAVYRFIRVHFVVYRFYYIVYRLTGI